ncbi:hypothetical protein FS749_010542 [Ceratobasidium sp. UAMH 11750]|nr:hypothetical protein FS749_010542 [Ceratobasidium sp. UAMH 11750]
MAAQGENRNVGVVSPGHKGDICMEDAWSAHPKHTAGSASQAVAPQATSIHPQHAPTQCVPPIPIPNPPAEPLFNIGRSQPTQPPALPKGTLRMFPAPPVCTAKQDPNPQLLKCSRDGEAPKGPPAQSAGFLPAYPPTTVTVEDGLISATRQLAQP